MNRKDPEKDIVKDFAIKAFLTVGTVLISVVTWFVLDLHSKLDTVLTTLPEHKIRIDHLEVELAKIQLRVIELKQMQAKHEDEITLESLTKK